MIAITTSIDIAAPPERVWRVLTDQEAYSARNPCTAPVRRGKMAEEESPMAF
jgi:hypothetical protein